jgi:uncharacterized protein YgiM (DUF1202 family)
VTIVLLVAFGVAALSLAGCESTKLAKGDDTTAQPAAPAPTPAAPAPAPQAPAPAAPAPAPAAPAATPPAPPAQAPMESARALFIKTSLANFREAPGTRGRILAVLRKGTRVDVLEARNQWYRVRLADGREGWVAESVTAATPE